MHLKIKLLPPYRRAGEKDTSSLELEVEELTVKELVDYLSREWQEKLEYPMVDEQKGYLTAEFIVNGKHAKLEQKLNSGDEITVVPYISGG